MRLCMQPDLCIGSRHGGMYSFLKRRRKKEKASSSQPTLHDNENSSPVSPETSRQRGLPEAEAAQKKEAPFEAPTSSSRSPWAPPTPRVLEKMTPKEEYFDWIQRNKLQDEDRRGYYLFKNGRVTKNPEWKGWEEEAPAHCAHEVAAQVASHRVGR